MYLDFFGFREKPFNLTPDPRFVFLSKNHREAFAHLLYGINNRTGFIALTGEVGTGKTTVLRALLNQLDPDHHRTALIFNPSLSPTELLQNINQEFGIPTYPSSASSLLKELNQFLLQQNAEGRSVVLIIDEGQDLEASVLEQIRLISNLETDREKLIQIVLSGQPELTQILKRKEMRQLSQRISVRYHLQPMDFQDTVDYINHRLEVAGGRGGVIFSRRALKRIYRYSHGFPRLINVASDRALLAGYTRDTARIGSRIVAAGIKDMKKSEAFYPLKRRLILPALAILGVFLAAVIFFTRPDFIGQFNTSQSLEATEKEKKKYPVIPSKEISRAMVTELGEVSESESARRAFNTLAGFWNAPPISEGANLNPFNGMERAALERQLRLYKFSGNLGTLLRIDCPAGLEMSLPGIPGKRFVSLVRRENEHLVVDPPIPGREFLSFSEMEKYWSGQGFILWKDSLNLLTRIYPGRRGAEVKQLQELLREAGNSGSPLTGVYDSETLSAVKEFQMSKGIKQDGIIGDQTLMFLYRSIDRFEVPRLTAGQK
ncbi:MAG TPA: AAA family ATPase [Thermodesulfobacteriota bacterium]|nr:AAA family ATPase [Thermodesulfobacteriota bacterium]